MLGEFDSGQEVSVAGGTEVGERWEMRWGRCLDCILSHGKPPGDFMRRSDFPWAVSGKQTKGTERKWETREEAPAGSGFRWGFGGRKVGGRCLSARAGRGESDRMGEGGGGRYPALGKGVVDGGANSQKWPSWRGDRKSMKHISLQFCALATFLHSSLPVPSCASPYPPVCSARAWGLTANPSH